MGYNGDKYRYFLMSNSVLKVGGYVADAVKILPGSKEWEEFKKMTLYMSLYTAPGKDVDPENKGGYLYIRNFHTYEEMGMYSLDFNVISEKYREKGW